MIQDTNAGFTDEQADGFENIIIFLSKIIAPGKSKVFIVPKGFRTIHAIIEGDTISATVEWYGLNKNANVEGNLIATSYLSGTTSDDTDADIDNKYNFFYCDCTAISGGVLTAAIGV